MGHTNTYLAHEATSQISVKSIQGKSTLTEAKILRPLKIFSLQNDTALQVIFSNYGGGFVEGDHIKIDLRCNEETKTAFTSQAHTRVYRSERAMPSRQEIHAKLGKGAFATFLCDPLVLHANSIFEQQQIWLVEDDSVLLFTDWFEAGRLLNGERFAFEAYHSEFKVVYKDIPWVWDKFHIQPSLIDPNSPGIFLHHGCYANVFLVGKDNLPRVQHLETIMRQLGEKYFKTTATLVATEAEIIGSFSKINDKVSLIRCSAKNNEILQNLMKDLAQALSHKDLLGFYPGHNI